MQFRNQRKKKALADTKNQYGRVAEENKALLEQLEFTQRENYEVTEHLREELLLKSHRIAELEAKILQVRMHVYLCTHARRTHTHTHTNKNTHTCT